MTGWTAIVPVKPFTQGKSRLALPDDLRAELALAFFTDVMAVLESSDRIDRVIVVDDAPLNAAIRGGAAEIAGPIVVVPADLPAIRADDLATVLDRAAGVEAAFCPDAAGEGTSLFMASSAALLQVAYGPGSAALHRDGGATELSDAPASLRRDVDTIADLHEAMALGVGPATTEVLREAFVPTR